MSTVNDRKLRKFQHSLQRHADIQAQDEPSKYVVLCNAGLSTGIKESDLIKTFGPFGVIENIILLPGKSFCAIAFANLQSAVDAHTNLNGHKILTQHGHPLYLTYTSTLPSAPNDENTEIPDGLKLIENFITPEEENILLSIIDWKSPDMENDLKNRKVKHFGYEFLYGINNINLNDPLKEGIPKECDFLWDRLKNHVSVDYPPEQLTVNFYNSGHGIPSHVDTHSPFLSPLISLSLGSTVVMEFKRLKDNNSYEYYKLPLPPRSMLILDGSSRYEWLHGIIPRTYDLINGKIHERGQRTSFTFRWIRTDKICDCNFPVHCDTYKNNESNKLDNYSDLAPIIEKQHVHKVYEEIASHFDDTRSKIWPCVENFVKKLEMGSILVDIGCGNGKNLHIRDDILQIGLEYSSALAEIAAWKTAFKQIDQSANSENLVQVIRGDCMNLPFSSNYADAVISIAVFHHLVTEERRKKAIVEAIRILRPSGLALITVWARDQSKHNEKTSYLKQDRKNRKSETNMENKSSVTENLKDENGQFLNVSLPVHVNRTQFFHQDMLVPWKLKNCKAPDAEQKEDCFMRFYHVFEDDELKNLCESLDRVAVVDYFYEQGNWCIVLQKQA